jgi:glycosyltransferase involved in cell wall biosynthesis
MFTPRDRAAARAGFGLTRPTLVSVGHLIDRKGHDLVVRAMADLPEFELLVVGEGEERPKLEALAADPAVAGRVRLTGALPHDRLPDVYSAADALVLASSREGWANVLLEAMACGTPVVASDVWGTPEVVATPEAGELMPERTPDGVVRAVRALFARPLDRAATRSYAEGFSWEDTTQGQLALFRQIIAG